MAARRQLQALRNHPNLQRFLIANARPTGRQLGVGSYGSVEELEVGGVVCAGKKIHETLIEQGNFGAENIATKYVEECQLMSDLRHPHLVQFLGVCFLSNSTLPVLVTERLLTSLDELLEHNPDIPLSLKRSILADVARGLVYLHSRSPPVIHRDLSAKNVLLNSAMVAKISDLGNARIVNYQPGQLARTLSRMPGTMVYMPPEAFDATSKYGPSLDSFSFGHLSLFTITQVFPGTLLQYTYRDPENPRHHLARTEVQRRDEYIQLLHQQLGEHHPLVRLVKQCLDDEHSERPSAQELLRQLEGMRAQIEDPYEHLTKLEAMRMLREKDEALREQNAALRKQNAALKEQDAALREQNAAQRKQNAALRAQDAALGAQDAALGKQNVALREQDAALREQDAALREQNAAQRKQNAAMRAQDAALREQDAALREQNAALREQDAALREKDAALREKDAALRVKDSELREKDMEMEDLRIQAQASGPSRQELEALQAQMEQLQLERSSQLTAKDVQLAAKDSEISRLSGGMRSLQADLEAREARIREMGAETQRRETENHRLMAELSHLQSQPQRTSVPLHPGASLTWEHCANLPAGMRDAQAVVLGNKVYVGGGDTLTTATACNIYSCDFTGDITWKTLKSPTSQSALTTYQERLVLVGGVDPSTATPTNQLRLRKDDETWTQPLPPMPTPRFGASAVSIEQRIVVAGGLGRGYSNVVEVYNGQQWVTTDPLPKCCYDMKSTLHDGFLYLMGGYSQDKSVFQCSVQALIEQATPHPPKQSTWNTIRDVPYEFCSVATFGGALVAVGGQDKGPKNSLHMYDPLTQSWVYVGKMPVAVGSTCTVTLPSGEMMVIGGWTKDTTHSPLVYKASLEMQ